MTAPALQGIDSRPIEDFELASTSAVPRQHFGIDPERYQPGIMVNFGYQTGKPAHDKTRRDKKDIVREN